MADAGALPWLLLIHQLPAKPDYRRVKVWRRLQRIGAGALKNSVWVLPRGEGALEDFHWLLAEIAADGGEAMLCETRFLAGLTAPQRTLLAQLATSRAPAGVAAGAAAAARTAPGPAAVEYRARTWVTRADVHVDRIASAWLIRGWIDPDAEFRFAGDPDEPPGEGELRFDTFAGEFTHDGDRCTFEVLARRFVPADGALAAIGRMVHDVDFKDAKYGTPATPGFALAIEGICARHAADAVRLERGAALLDDLYAGLVAGTSAGVQP